MTVSLGWAEAYSHDAAGQPIAGSLEMLAAASGQGCEVKVAIGGERDHPHICRYKG